MRLRNDLGETGQEPGGPSRRKEEQGLKVLSRKESVAVSRSRKTRQLEVRDSGR